MPKVKKIDKKKAVTFQLVHRSQQDPLVADDTAPQRVLVPVENKGSKKTHEERLEEQHKYGIYYNDDCDYLEYLKDAKDNEMQWPNNVDKELARRREEAKSKLPREVFASEIEEEVGMLGKAAPESEHQLHLDPDVVAAMDDDFDYSDPENQLEDNFIELADGVASDQEFDGDEDIEMDSNLHEQENDYVSSVSSENSLELEETKQKKYPMSCGMLKRGEQLQLLDRRFEKMLEKFDESHSDSEESGGIPLDSDILQQCAEEFEQSQQRHQLDKDTNANKITLQLSKRLAREKEEFEYITVEEKEKYDCQSILSTYSRTYNVKGLIREPPKIKKGKIAIDKLTGMPKDELGPKKLTTKDLNDLNEQNNDFCNRGPTSVGIQTTISKLSELSIRPKNETVEEKKDRKKNLKEYRKQRRIEKKINKEAFTEEAKRQSKILINNRNNIQGNKIL